MTFKTPVVMLAVFAVFVGVVMRLDGLERNLFWQDEAFSMLRVTGHDQADLDRIFDGRIHPASTLLALARLDPARGLRATVASLREEPQRGPLYYVGARLWAQTYGDGIGPMRLFSVVIGLAGIGFAFLLGRTATDGVSGGAVLAALVAISPIEMRFSDQVREYTLLATVTLAGAWLFLRAVARPTPIRFVGYAASVAAGFLTSPLFAFALAAHAIAIGVAARRDGRAPLVGWIASVAAAIVLVASWYVGSLGNTGAQRNDVAWLLGSYALKSFALKWAFNIGAVFFDGEFAHVGLGVVLLPIFAILAVALVSAFTWPRDAVVRALIVATVFCGAVPLVVLDLARHAHFETVTRYEMTTWIGIDMLVAMLVARGINAGNVPRFIALAAFAFLIVCGTISALLVIRPYGLWWDDNEHLDERAVARAIERGGRGIVVATSDGSAQPYALVLSRYIASATEMLLYRRTLPTAATTAVDTWFFAPDASVVREVDRRVRPDRTLRNVSPAIGQTVPDLRGARDMQASAALRVDNALWRIMPSHTTSASHR